jgi:AcrR family transcriptional regulator
MVETGLYYVNELRMSNPSPRQRLLETAARLFYLRGFRAIGVDTLIATSGVAKMSLYRHFASKDELIVAYLEAANRDFWQWFEQAIAPHAGSPRRQLHVLFEAVGALASAQTCHGCTFQGAAAEFPDLPHPAHQVALAHKQCVLARLRDLAAQAGAHDPTALAEALLLLMDGAFVARRMFGPANPGAKVGQAADVLIADAIDGPSDSGRVRAVL